MPAAELVQPFQASCIDAVGCAGEEDCLVALVSDQHELAVGYTAPLPDVAVLMRLAQRRVAAAEVQQWRALLDVAFQADEPADHDLVVAAVEAAIEPAVEDGQHPVQTRTPRRAMLVDDVLPARGGATTREVGR